MLWIWVQSYLSNSGDNRCPESPKLHLLRVPSDLQAFINKIKDQSCKQWEQMKSIVLYIMPLRLLSHHGNAFYLIFHLIFASQYKGDCLLVINFQNPVFLGRPSSKLEIRALFATCSSQGWRVLLGAWGYWPGAWGRIPRQPPTYSASGSESRAPAFISSTPSVGSAKEQWNHGREGRKAQREAGTMGGQ